ncbi:MAG: Rieske 2Fe-2S domain-containing protein [Gammaproteobacteria bacterium]|nr:Rieske 2Fe-2S domain-containing protein [Gammaproteobacteria bacterium]
MPATLQIQAGSNKLSEIEFVQLTTKADVEENRVACFEINGHSVVLSQFKGEFFALANMCSHAQQTFDNGRVRGHKLLCPLHGAIFDIRDGSVLGPPALRPIKSYPLKIENEEIYICLNVD